MIVEDDKLLEVKLVNDILTHPAGFHLGVFGMLHVRSCSESGASHDPNVTFEVDWEDADEKVQHVSFTTSWEAAEFFVKKREELRLGVDYEIEEMIKEPT